jgi:hypothetical protein
VVISHLVFYGLPLVLDGDETGHPVFCVSVRSFSGITKDFTSAGR